MDSHFPTAIDCRAALPFPSAHPASSRAATEVAMEEVPDLFPGEAVGRSLQSLADADRQWNLRRRSRRGRPWIRNSSPTGRGLRRDWRRCRVRVRRAGCVPRREVCLRKQIFPLLFYFCEGRWAGPGYAHPQVSYQHSPRLRLLVSDVSFYRKRAVPRRHDPPGLPCMHRDLASGWTPRDVGLGALR
jgi:hypothetical protein